MLFAMKKLVVGFDDWITRVARARTCELLLAGSERRLADTGFSRQLLEQGVDAWPWRSETVSGSLPPMQLDLMAKERAIRELKDYSDQELGDLGISRGSIEDSVANGRAGIDGEQRREVAYR